MQIICLPDKYVNIDLSSPHSFERLVGVIYVHCQPPPFTFFLLDLKQLLKMHQ